MGGRDSTGKSSAERIDDEHSSSIAGDTRQLSILVYEPGSRQDRDIERELGLHRQLATVAFDMSFEGDDVVGEDIDNLRAEFAEIWDIEDQIYHPTVRDGWIGEFGYNDTSIDQRPVKDSWDLQFSSATSLTPFQHAARGLKIFYEHVIDAAAAKLAAGEPPAKEIEFRSHGLSLHLMATQPISLVWVIRFALFMENVAMAFWPNVYQGVVTNTHWKFARVYVAMAVIAGPTDL